MIFIQFYKLFHVIFHKFSIFFHEQFEHDFFLRCIYYFFNRFTNVAQTLNGLDCVFLPSGHKFVNMLQVSSDEPINK